MLDEQQDEGKVQKFRLYTSRRGDTVPTFPFTVEVNEAHEIVFQIHVNNGQPWCFLRVYGMEDETDPDIAASIADGITRGVTLWKWMEASKPTDIADVFAKMRETFGRTVEIHV